MLKEKLFPSQERLFSQGRCLICGAFLSEAIRIKKNHRIESVICQCGRLFIYDKENKKYCLSD